MPQEVVDTLLPVLREVYESKEFADFMAQRGFGMVWRETDDFRAFMADSDQAFGEVMQAVGLAR